MVIFGKKWTFDLPAIVMKESVIKNCGLREMKGSTYTKKMRPAGSILVELQHDSVIWKIA